MGALEQIRARLNSAHVYGMFLTDEERSCLDGEIDDILKSIAASSTIQEAEPKLHELGEVEDLLATLFCGYRIPLSDKQYSLFREYDRWDIPQVRAAAFSSIKKGEFPFQPLFLGDLPSFAGDSPPSA